MSSWPSVPSDNATSSSLQATRLGSGRARGAATGSRPPPSRPPVSLTTGSRRPESLPESFGPASLACGSLACGSLATGSFAPGSLAPGSLAAGSRPEASFTPGSLGADSRDAGSLLAGSLAPGAAGDAVPAEPFSVPFFSGTTFRVALAPGAEPSSAHTSSARQTARARRFAGPAGMTCDTRRVDNGQARDMAGWYPPDATACHWP
jgi:hypothetical protein